MKHRHPLDHFEMAMRDDQDVPASRYSGLAWLAMFVVGGLAWLALGQWLWGLV